LNDVSKIFPEY